jgi:type I restriction enzyme S subunit
MSKTKQDFKYVFYAIKSAKDYLIYKAVGGGQPNISQSTLKQLWLPVPPLSEQQSIASYLDTKCTEIDDLIAIKQAKIEELKEYKKSVIYEYVTGKKEVV